MIVHPSINTRVDSLLNQAIIDQGSPAAAATGATGTDGSSGSSPTVYLTPDAIMAYCASRLHNLDSQVQKFMNQQQALNGVQALVQKALQQVTSLQQTVSNGVTPQNTDTAQALEKTLEDAISQMEQSDPNCPGLLDLEHLHDTIMATGTGGKGASGYYCSSNANRAPGTPPTGRTPPPGVHVDGDSIFGQDELTGFSTALNNASSGLSSGAELGMIQVQSLMSQRSTAIQLSTNIMQSIDDGTSKIAANVGHG